MFLLGWSWIFLILISSLNYKTELETIPKSCSRTCLWIWKLVHLSHLTEWFLFHFFNKHLLGVYHQPNILFCPQWHKVEKTLLFLLMNSPCRRKDRQSKNMNHVVNICANNQNNSKARSLPLPHEETTESIREFKEKIFQDI